MKKTILKILLILALTFSFSNLTFAEEEVKNTVITTEKVPWASCVPEMSWNTSWAWPQQPKPTGKYECTVWRNFSSVMMFFWDFIKYATFLVWLAWVLFIVINWILYSMWGADDSLKTEAKKKITKTIVWLIVLLLSWIILNLIAPWVYK